MTDEHKTEQFLHNQTHMVATVVLDDGSPWAVPLFIQRREGMRLFEWDSRVDTVHSLAIERDPRAAVTVFRVKSGEYGECGYYATGSAAVVERRDDGYARYRFVAERAWLNDETHTKRELVLKNSDRVTVDADNGEVRRA